jgi:tetratricopeptide (TPR) repeat protein
LALDVDTRAILYESAAGLISRISAERTLVLVIEDLHWADGSTLDLLRYLLSTVRGSKFLLVATFRTDNSSPETERAVAEFGRDQRVERIDLSRLNWNETGALVEGIVGIAPSVTLLNRIYERSGGNPFFAEELLAAGPEAAGVSPGLRQVALSRVRDLSPATQELVRVVAVSGRALTHGQVLALAEMPEAQVLAAIEESVLGHVLTSEPGSDCYSFRHALVREVVYEDTLPGERQRIHRGLAAQLAARHPTDPSSLGELAHHLDRGGSVRAAVAAYVEAGLAAEGVSAFAEALANFERALALLPEAPGITEDARTLPSLTWLREQVARNAETCGDPQRAAALVKLALQEVDRESDPQRAATLLSLEARYAFGARREIEALVVEMEVAAALVREIPPTPASAWVLAAWARSFCLKPGTPEAVPAANEALRVARAAGAKAEEGLALGLLGAYRLERDVVGGISEVRAALRVSLEAGDIDSILRLYMLVSGTLYDVGDFVQLAVSSEEAVSVTETLGGARPTSLILFANLAQVCLDTGDWARAGILIARASGLAGTASAHLEYHFPAARLAAGRGFWADALAHLEVLVPTDSDVIPIREATVRAEALVGQRKWAEARELVAKELPGRNRCSTRSWRLRLDGREGFGGFERRHHRLSRTL